MARETLPLQGGNWASLSEYLEGIPDSAVTDAVADGVSDDTAAIQRALNKGGHVYLQPKGNNNFLISAPLVIYPNTILELHPLVTITLKAGSNCNMIHNAAWVAGSGRDTNIRIVGGTWNRQNNGGVGQQLHTILMQRVDSLHIGNMTCLSTAGKYFICPYACTDFVIEEITCNVSSAAVQADGACKYGRISGIYGTTGDDSVALTPSDFAAYNNGDLGDMTDIVIECVYTTTGTGTRAVKVLGCSDGAGTPYNCRRITIRNVAATTDSDVVYLGGDASQSTTFNGSLIDIRLESVKQLGTGHNIVVFNTGTGEVDGLFLSRLAMPDTDGKKTLRFDASSAALTVKGAVVRDSFLTSTTNQGSAIYLNNGPTVELALDNVYFNPPVGAYVIQLNGANSTLTSVKAINCKLDGQTTGGGLLQTAALSTQVITDVFVENLTVNKCAHCLGDLQHTGSTTTFYVLGVKASTITDLINVRTGVSVNFRTLLGLNGVNADTITNAGTAVLADVPLATPTYSASITPITNKGQWQTITVTNATAFTINAPTIPPDSAHTRTLTIEILNSSGGAMGVITWNGAFVFDLLAAWANPANTFRRQATFTWNGTKWICTSISTSDY